MGGVVRRVPAKVAVVTEPHHAQARPDMDAERAMLREEIAALTDLIERRGITATGSRGQTVLNPALAARRAAIESLRKLGVAEEKPDATLADLGIR